ncbi:MAG: hypothetical protein ABR941_05120, partial [Thermoleophilia bacterium]
GRAAKAARPPRGRPPPPQKEIPMDEIAPGIWRWTARHPEWHTRIEWGHEVASFAIVGDGALALVDPLLPAADSDGRVEIDRALERLAREAAQLDIMITIPYHARSAE